MRFDQYMQNALYHPRFGYYSRGDRVFGAEGDFVTAPELTPLFGQTIAKALEPLFAQGLSSIYEFGAGRGKLAADIIQCAGAALETYWIVELSGGLREVQEQHLREALTAEDFHKVKWLTKLPERLQGIVLTNELLDAIPVRRFRWSRSEVQEAWVDVTEEGNLAMAYRRVEGTFADQIKALEAAHGPWPEGFESEFGEQVAAWVRTTTERLEGFALMIDYGYSASEYYQTQHAKGHLRAHARHLAHDDFLINTGEQDLTSHVDFSSVYEAMAQSGAELEGYVSQASFLIENGLLDLATQLPELTDPEKGGKTRQAIHTLTSEAAMGLGFKAMAWSRNFECQENKLLASFRDSDLSHML